MSDSSRAAIRRESRGTRWAIIAAIVGALFTVTVMQGQRLPLSGTGSLGTIAAWIGATAAGFAFGGAFLLEARHGYDGWRRRLPLAKRVLDVVALSVGMALLSHLLIVAISTLFGLGFRGMTIDPLGGAVLAGAATAAVVYAATLGGAQVTAEGLATLATLVIFIGTIASMISAPDDSWWQLHFSQLGNAEGISAYRFNLALIVTGLILTVLANYAGRDLERGLNARGRDEPKLVNLLTWLFAGIGLCMMVVGLVPDNVNVFVHVGAATGMVIVFSVFLFFTLRRMPDVPRDFTVFSIGVVAGIVVAALLWIPIGYYNLTGVEFVAAGLLFAWLTLFVRMASVYARGTVQSA